MVIVFLWFRTSIFTTGMLACGLDLVKIAPIPKSDQLLTITMLREALGQSHFSKDVHRIRKCYKEPPTATYFVDSPSTADCFYLSWKQRGLSLEFDKYDKLKTIFLYTEPTESGYKAYRGDLPEGLDRSMNSQEVKGKLGKPTEALDSASEKVNARWFYKEKGIQVNFTKNHAEADGSVIQCVIITQIDKK